MNNSQKMLACCGLLFVVGMSIIYFIQLDSRLDKIELKQVNPLEGWVEECAEYKNTTYDRYMVFSPFTGIGIELELLSGEWDIPNSSFFWTYQNSTLVMQYGAGCTGEHCMKSYKESSRTESKCLKKILVKKSSDASVAGGVQVLNTPKLDLVQIIVPDEIVQGGGK